MTKYNHKKNLHQAMVLKYIITERVCNAANFLQSRLEENLDSKVLEDSEQMMEYARVADSLDASMRNLVSQYLACVDSYRTNMLKKKK